MRGLLQDLRVTIDGEHHITLHVVNIEFFQTITTPVFSGTLTIMDSTDLINTIKLRKGSKVEIFFTKEHVDIKGYKDVSVQFVVYKVGNKVQVTQQSYLYTVHVASSAFIDNATTRLIKSLKNEGTAAVAEIVKESFSGYTLVCEKQSTSKVHINVSNKSPFIAIGEILRHTHYNGVADYLFYQSDNNEFTCISMQTMLERDSGITFMQLPNGTTASRYPYNILDFKIDHFDGALNLSQGFYENTVLVYDAINKKFTSTASKNDTDNKSLSDGEVFKNQKNANISRHAVNDAYQNKDVTAWGSSRKMSLLRLEQEKVILQCEGTAEIFSKIGCAAELLLPNPNHDDDLNIYPHDRKRSGKYIITGIKHNLNAQRYLVTVELVKRAFEPIQSE